MFDGSMISGQMHGHRRLYLLYICDQRVLYLSLRVSVHVPLIHIDQGRHSLQGIIVPFLGLDVLKPLSAWILWIDVGPWRFDRQYIEVECSFAYLVL